MATLSDITNLYQDVLLRCPGVPLDAALIALKKAVRDFAIQTTVWRENIDIVTVEGQQAYALPVSVTGTRVHRVINVTSLCDVYGFTDLVIGATTTQVSSAARPFTDDDVGDVLNVTGGTGFTVGTYTIQSMASGIATLNASVGTTASSSGEGTMVDIDSESEPFPDTAYWNDITADRLYFKNSYIPGKAGTTIRVVVAIRPEWWPDSSVFPTWILDRWGDGIAAGASLELFPLPSFNKNVNALLLDRTQRAWNEVLIDAKLEIEREGTARSSGITPT
jgi:hypothetical protein